MRSSQIINQLDQAEKVASEIQQTTQENTSSKHKAKQFIKHAGKELLGHAVDILHSVADKSTEVGKISVGEKLYELGTEAKNPLVKFGLKRAGQFFEVAGSLKIAKSFHNQNKAADEKAQYHKELAKEEKKAVQEPVVESPRPR